MRLRTPSEIYKGIPDMSVHTLNNYSKRGFVCADARDANRSGIAKLYSPIEAMKAGIIRYFNVLGYELYWCSLIAKMILADPGELGEDEINNPHSRNKCLVLAGSIPVTVATVYDNGESMKMNMSQRKQFEIRINHSYICFPERLLHGFNSYNSLCFVMTRPIVERVASWLRMDLREEFSFPLNPWSGSDFVLHSEEIEETIQAELIKTSRLLGN